MEGSVDWSQYQQVFHLVFLSIRCTSLSSFRYQVEGDSRLDSVDSEAYDGTVCDCSQNSEACDGTVHSCVHRTVKPVKALCLQDSEACDSTVFTGQ